MKNPNEVREVPRPRIRITETHPDGRVKVLLCPVRARGGKADVSSFRGLGVSGHVIYQLKKTRVAETEFGGRTIKFEVED